LQGTDGGGRGLAIVTAEQLAERRLIGGGGFGRIERARHRGWGIDVALKMLHGTCEQCAENTDLLREAELMNGLRFPHVVSLIGLYRDRAEPLGIVMEFMENGSLASLLDRLSPPWALRFRLIHEVALGMNYLHGLEPQLLHLDLNPRNVLLDDGFHAKIADFGLSKLMQIVSSASHSSLAGTLEYLPPEAFDGEINRYKPAATTDVYSFGILMWSVLSGKRPYSALEGRNRDIIKVLIPQAQRPDLDLLASPEPVEKLEDLKRLVTECWHNNPKKRPLFPACRVQTEEAFRAHEAGVAHAVHRVRTILSTLATSSSIGRLSDRMDDLSLRDGASEGIGELRTEPSMRPDPPPLAAAIPSLGNGPPTREETTIEQQSRPTPGGAMSAMTHQDRKISPELIVTGSQVCQATNQKPRGEMLVSGVPGRDNGPRITIQCSYIEGLQVGHQNVMNITKRAKPKKKSRP
ncbi:ankyrin repeat and protein kinase domain-containing protein 1, partial [Heptranchias perlo]|uniref:ankyrin repeat and protein kinase domain-containing protein 1 n=1 Tax=Heptranchias perlo TaxID=212740 RepID=UPI003559A58B